MGNEKILKLKKYLLGIFITLILMFPIIITAIQHIIFQGFNFGQSPFKSAVNIVVQNFSFYATALSITFTAFVFIQNEHKRSEKESKENEKNREIRIKELEAIKDNYRPTFIIEEGTRPQNKKIKLLMRDDNLYLEEVLLYKTYNNFKRFEKKIANIKSGEYVSEIMADSFFITAKTQIGEVILFGYLNGGIKIHKYLKDAGNPLYPSEGKDFKEYNQEEINKNWGNYNTIDDSDNLLDQMFFYDNIKLRNKIKYNFTNLIQETIKSSTADKFFHSLPADLYKLIGIDSINLECINKILRLVLNEGRNNRDKFFFTDINEELNLTNLQNNLTNITNSGYSLSFKFPRYLKEQDLDELIEYLDKVISYCENQDPNPNVKNILKNICEILIEIFKSITVSEILDDKINSYKSTIYNYIKID